MATTQSNPSTAISHVLHAKISQNVAKECRLKAKRIGIYSGTFDPVHAGHIAFALQALNEANIDHVYFMPERHPRHKQHVAHFAHRVAMLRRALSPYTQLDVLEIEDKEFSVTRTLPRLQQRFMGTELVYLCGSDVVRHMAVWPHIRQLLGAVELCVGLRDGESRPAVEVLITQLPFKPRGLSVIDSYSSQVSSSAVRQAIREHRTAKGLLRSVRLYATQEWLYL